MVLFNPLTTARYTLIKATILAKIFKNCRELGFVPISVKFPLKILPHTLDPVKEILVFQK
jgi:hypothetical protein